jgi:hypothetical protein
MTNVTESTKAALRRRANEARTSPNPHFREAAALTRGVPVHADMGGTLVIDLDGDVVAINGEDGSVSKVDDAWRLVALTKAANLFPELAELRPQRPPDANTCAACKGCGAVKLFGHSLDCGVCYSTGWTRQ